MLNEKWEIPQDNKKDLKGEKKNIINSSKRNKREIILRLTRTKKWK